MKAFEIDYKKLAVLLTPTFLRKPVFTALVRILMQPLTTLHLTFRTKRDDHLFNLAHNGQVCYLKDALNSLDDLDYSDGFEIEDINAIGEFVFVYDETEWLQDTSRVLLVNDAPDFIMIYDEAAITASTEAFIVYVPARYTFDGSKPADPRIEATVEKYRLVSRTATYRTKS